MKRQHGTGGLIKMRGCKFWYAQYYGKDGKKFRESTRTQIRKEAEAVLRQKMGDSERGLTPQSELKKLRYGHLRQALLDDYKAQNYKSLQVLADGTETIWGLRDLDAFFDYKPPDLGKAVTAITSDSCREFARKRQAEGIGNAYINRSLAKLRRMLNIAYEDGKLSTVPKIRMLKEPPARKGFLPRDQFENLLAALPERLRPLITFLYYCGVRLGEAQQITWSQVDLKAGLIRLEEEQTKTDEARTVPIPDVLIAMLRPLEQKDAVFDSTNLRKEWLKACDAVGLGQLDKKTWRYSGLMIHDLRRSAIKNLMKAGVSEKVAMTISGHKTRSVFDRYHIVDTRDVQTAMRKVEALPVEALRLLQAASLDNGLNLVRKASPDRKRNRLTA